MLIFSENLAYAKATTDKANTNIQTQQRNYLSINP